MLTIFHVGYPKAASTMLQKQLFALHPSLINLGLYPSSNIGNDNVKPLDQENFDKIPYLSDSRIKALYKILTQSGGLEFDFEAAKSLWQQIANDYATSNSHREISSNIVLSHEAVTSGRFAHPEILEKARRIREVFGCIKIIMICRRQQEMLKSLYRDHPFDPRSLESRPRPVGFREWLAIDLERGPLSLTKSLYFDRAASVFEDLFGQDNVLVLPMELLQSDLRLFSEQISGFLGIEYEPTYLLLDNPPINAGISAYGYKYRLMKAKLMPWIKYLGPLKKYLLPLEGFVFDFLKSHGAPAEITIDNDQEQFLKQLFAKDNASLANRRKLPLHDLGYYL